jgi:hypothetical protein
VVVKRKTNKRPPRPRRDRADREEMIDRLAWAMLDRACDPASRDVALVTVTCHPDIDEDGWEEDLALNPRKLAALAGTYGRP